MAGEHSLLSPSGAHRWMRCPGSLLLESTISDQPSKYAAEGTVAHQIIAECLQSQLDGGKAVPNDYLGRMMSADGFEFCVGKDMVGHVEDHIALVMSYAKGGLLLVDKRVDFSSYIDQPNSSGTADSIIIHPDRITVIDFKYGAGVKVDAEDNEQMQLYALGTLNDYGMLVEAEKMVMVIHQPRISEIPSEDTKTIKELEAFGEKAKLAATVALSYFDQSFDDLSLEPGEKQCRFCKAKARCPAIENEVEGVVGHLATAADFADLAEANTDSLAVAMTKVPLVEHWCLAIRAEVERRMFEGVEVPGFKIVQGRQGNRAWSNAEDAEKKLKGFRLKSEEIYDYKLISPTTAEKLLKKKKPKWWEQLQSLISRADGKPSVAPVTDKRPAMDVQKVSAEFFRDLIANSEKEEA